jgi:dinuclear metal center YbgI/SA1388 family protein
MRRAELQTYLDQLLEVARFRDYCPNGLQVEGRDSIGTIITGVTASRALLDAAMAAGADAVIVHHGYFWRGEDARITGLRKHRLAMLLCNDINLFAFHLPLDVHPGLGNNVQLAKRMGWTVEGRFGDQDVGCYGAAASEVTSGFVAAELGRVLGRTACILGEANRPVRRIAWCTGAAQGLFEQAVAAGADLYVSGEISEPNMHVAHESGIPYIAAGHHATERYGIQALGEHLAQTFALDCRFVDIPNPV